jgi:hypothetical protein
MKETHYFRVVEGVFHWCRLDTQVTSSHTKYYHIFTTVLHLWTVT